MQIVQHHILGQATESTHCANSTYLDFNAKKTNIFWIQTIIIHIHKEGLHQTMEGMQM